MANKIIPYRSDLKELARRLRSEMTPAEKTLWKVIRKKALNVEFHRQVPLLDYIVDFYCHEIGLAIEVDGNIHNTSFLEDAKRQGRLELYGIRFYRVQNEEVLYHLEKVLNDLKELITKQIQML